MEGKEEHIIAGAREIFIKKGIKALTMDEIAKELKVSKKTIYVFFRNREMLLKRCLEDYLNEQKEIIEGILNKGIEPIHEFCEFSQMTVETLKVLNPSFYQQLTSYPKSYQILMDFYWTYLLKVYTDNIIRGQQKGMFRDEVDAELKARLHLSNRSNLVNTAMFPIEKYSFIEVFLANTTMFLRGICTNEGIKVMEELHCSFKEKLNEIAK